MISFVLEIPARGQVTSLAELFVSKPGHIIQFIDNEYEILAWGDPIVSNEFVEKLAEKHSAEFIVKNIYGHYYYAYLNQRTEELFLGNSLFSILPVYYHIAGRKITISDNAFTIGRGIGSNEISKRFILETHLFNYPLFNHSIITEVNLLPVNSYIQYSRGSCSIIKHTETADLFGESPLPLRKSIDQVSDFFLEELKKYLPEEHFACSLTGGFDGRTLVAGGLFHKQDFSVYSFGQDVSRDITIAEDLSSVSGLNFHRITLDKEYVVNDSLDNGREFVINASGTSSFARAHYLFAAKKLARLTNYIITGNFGSEILRAMHTPGVVISPNLYTIFKEDRPDIAFSQIEKSDAFQSLRHESFITEWDQLKHDIIDLPCYSKKYSSLTRNRKFYVFVLEEIFRKYFGAEMISQFRYLNNRTPFLDIDFLRVIFRSSLSGIHSDFFENNPLRRYKGQLLYSHIIRKAYPIFGTIITDKGYKPDDLLNLTGKLRVASGWLNKRSGKHSFVQDPNCVLKAWDNNKKFWMEALITNAYFDREKIEKSRYREIVYRACSLAFSSGL